MLDCEYPPFDSAINVHNGLSPAIPRPSTDASHDHADELDQEVSTDSAVDSSAKVSWACATSATQARTLASAPAFGQRCRVHRPILRLFAPSGGPDGRRRFAGGGSALQRAHRHGLGLGDQSDHLRAHVLLRLQAGRLAARRGTDANRLGTVLAMAWRATGAHLVASDPRLPHLRLGEWPHRRGSGAAALANACHSPLATAPSPTALSAVSGGVQRRLRRRAARPPDSPPLP